MKRWLSGRRGITAAVACIAVAGACMLGLRDNDSDFFFRINKSIDIFGRVYKEVALNYVDPVDPEKFIEAGIDGMLGTLDPYTNFISEKEADEVELITAGKYGGIGVTIGIRDGYITIMSLMDGYSAQRQGLQPGDRIIEVDGTSLVGVKPDQVRSMTRGEPGSETHLKIERDGEPKPLEFTLIREEIQLKNVSYADFVGDGIAYVHIERFSRGAGDELRLALRELRLRGVIKGVILDLRDNPGGLLDVAVDVVEKFAPKGSLVVSTRGRRPDSERKYFVEESPMMPDVPLVVLINRGSASASEIVAGAIQDLDRGVIMGTRSFGKGLVQTIAPLSYNTQLKMTTAKYYTPSGRCIQEINYAARNKDGVFATTPDSLRKEFRTADGRPEFEAGGITPDTVVAPPEHSGIFNELLRKSMLFKFATRFAAGHTALPGTDDSLAAAFTSYLESEKFTYEGEGGKKVEELAAFAAKENMSADVRNEIAALKGKFAVDLKGNIAGHRAEILSGLKPELMARWGGEKARMGSALKDDPQVKAAAALLTRPSAYTRLLSPK